MLVLNDDEIRINRTEMINILAEIYDLDIPWDNKCKVVDVIRKHLDQEGEK